MAFIIVTPLKIEYQNLCKRFSLSSQGEPTQIGRIPATYFKSLNLCISLCGHGKAQAALQSQYIIDRFPQKIEGFFCCGSAGSLDESILPGDIVIARQTLEHDYKLLFIQKPLPVFDGSIVWIKKIQAMTELFRFKTHVIRMASGDEDIMQVERKKHLKQQNACQAVAWEGAGVARTCAFNNIPWLEIRAITDMASTSSVGEFKDHLHVSMENLAQFMTSLITSLGTQ